MAGKAGLLLVALMVGGAVAFSKKSGASSSLFAPSTGQNQLAPGSGKYDTPGGPVMQAVLEQTIDRELATDTSIANLTELANACTPMWPLATAALMARIAQLQATGSPIAPPAPPPPIIPLPPPDASPPYTPPVAVVTNPSPPVTTLPPIVITGDPTGGGGAPPAPSGPQPWDPSAMTAPSLNPASIPSSYKAKSQETKDVQNALNSWANTVGYSGNEIPLTSDGLFGKNTQQAAGSFQVWANATQNAGLTVDGLPGSFNAEGNPTTQSYLVAFGDITSGSY